MTYSTSDIESKRISFLNRKMKQHRDVASIELNELTKSYPWQPFVDLYNKVRSKSELVK